MPVSEESAASRRFVASGPRMKTKWAAVVVYGSIAGMFIFAYAAHAAGLSPFAGHALMWLFIVIPYLGFVVFVMKPKKLRIGVNGEGLTINEGAGGVFPLVGAKLGEWYAPGFGTTGGVALHVGDGRHRFVLGGRDHRIDPGMRLDAPPVRSIDAWLSASDFDALLTMLGPRSELGGGGAAPGGPICCLLFENSTLFRTLDSLRGRRPQPKVALELDGDVIRLTDVATRALIVWAVLSQVTASPGKHTFPGPQRITWPTLDVRVPGLRRILIANPEGRRFSWHDRVPRLPSPDFVVSAADWLTLVQKFGLEPLLEVRDI
jgi:hypothetical protein